MGAQLGTDLLKTVASAGGGLKKSGIDPGEILDLEDLGRGIGTVLGEATVHCHTVGVKVLTEKRLASSAVEALIAKLTVVGSDTVANSESIDVLDHVG